MRILYVNYELNMGGIETFLINTTKKLYKENNVDFMTIAKHNTTFYYENLINSMNCNIYKLNNKVGKIKLLKQMIDIIRNKKYDVVHANCYVSSSTVLLAAKICKVKVRIAHSHSSWEPKNFKQKIKYFINKTIIKLCATDKIACSSLAGKRLFGNSKFEILENGVFIDKYKYSKETSEKLRAKLSIPMNAKVIGHVGRFDRVKNHRFIIKIFQEYIKKHDNTYLLLVGDGPEMSDIKDIVKKEKIEDKVIFAGSVNNCYDYYSAMDCMVFPSFYEGLPFTFVESQINGLNIVASDTISKDSNLINNVSFLNLNDEISKWCTMIENKIGARHFDDIFFKKSNYNIDNTVAKLIEVYKNK